ncbi:hypothetical protein C8Q75DRAFT_817135 [Abortiporus biennis]|nr:hypothetical protein C8Q75DRAFT_817135 [Abortiporus biennis]
MNLMSSLRTLWVLIIFWFEYGAFYYYLLGCSWPDSSFKRAHRSHVLLVSDPQVLREQQSSRRKWLDDIRRFLYELTIKKNWSFAASMNPQAVVFLGDMLAAGSHVQDEDEYDRYHGRFKKLFPVANSVKTFYAPGNEDIGLRTDPRVARSARQHYQQYFGATNQQALISNHSFIILDSPGLVEEDYQRAEVSQEYSDWQPIPNGPVEFIKRIEKKYPTILFSHIPLARPETATCGPLRESGSIRRGVGPGYQNTLGKQTTNFLFDTVNPSVVFSGDDRDYCEYNHRIPQVHNETASQPLVREVTVKSISPVHYIRHPGFHLLSVAGEYDSQSASFADRPCILPNYYNHYKGRLLPFAFLTFFVLLLSRYRMRRTRGKTPLPTFIPHSPEETTSEQWTLVEPEDGGYTSRSDLSVDGDFIGRSPRLSPKHPFPSSSFRVSSSTFLNPSTRKPSHSGSRTPTLQASIQSSTPILPSFLATTPPPSSSDQLDDYDHDDPMCPYDSPPVSPRVSISQSQPRKNSGNHNGHRSRGSIYDLALGQTRRDPNSSYDDDPSMGSGAVTLLMSASPRSSYFPPTPSTPDFRRMQQNLSSKVRWKSLSWGFVLGGRMRRVTLSIPAIWRREFWRPSDKVGLSLLEGVSVDYHRRYDNHGLFLGTLLDFSWIITPALLLWCLFTWWTLL